MKQIFFTSCLIATAISANAQTLQFEWAKRMGGTSLNAGYSACVVDAPGNVYTTGMFWGTADFDPGPGTFNMTAAGLSDAFVSKLDSAGNFAWAKQLGGSEGEIGYAIALDDSGNVYTTGQFEGNASDFDPGPGTYNLTTAGALDIFVSKLDASGDFVWAKKMGGTQVQSGRSVTIDASGNVLTTGAFHGTVDFDPGPGIYNLTSAGYGDIFVSKLDASGNFVWAKRMGGPAVTVNDSGDGIAVDASGNVYTTGQFSSVADFDPGPGTFNLTGIGINDMFVSKLDASGNFVWAKEIGSPNVVNGYGIALDASANVYTTGSFTLTTDFDPGSGTFNLISAGSGDVFVCKLDPSGNFISAVQMGGTANDVGTSLALDASGNVYITGIFDGTADFDPGAGSFNLTTAGASDIFISKLNPSNNYVWAGQMGGTGMDWSYSIDVATSGCVYTAGHFFGTADFDPGASTYNLTSAGDYDIFVDKLCVTIPLPIELLSFNASWTDVTQTEARLEWRTASEVNSDYFIIERSPDGVNFEQVSTQAAAGSSYATLHYTILDSEPLDGVSYYRLRQVDLDGSATTSQVVSLVPTGNNSIVVYPNPTSGPVTIDLGERHQQAKLTLRDALGRVVLVGDYVDVSRVSFDVAQPPGFYTVEITGKGKEVARASVLKQ